MHLALAAVLAVLELAPSLTRAVPSPAIGLSFRTATGLDERLAGPDTALYRAQPEILVDLPSGRLDVFAGGGVGPAYVVRPKGRGEGVGVTVSGAAGLRFPLEGAKVLAMARAEGLGGGGMAITFDLQMSFDR